MRKESETEIREMRFRTTQLPATKGINVFTMVTRLAGAGLAKGLSAAESADSLRTMQLDKIGEALETIMEMIGPEQVVALIKDLLECTEARVDGAWKPCTGEDFDSIFAGRYRTMFDACSWVFEENFNEVFSLSSIVDKVKAVLVEVRTKAKSTSSKRSGKKSGRK